MNVAQKYLERYDSDDFRSIYANCLNEVFHNGRGDIENRIISLFNVSNYETEKHLKNHKIISREQAKLIYSFIQDNFEVFVKEFRSWYSGETSLCSVSFGEQEEQLDGIGKYGIEYLRKVFSNVGYFVDKNYAYYDLSSCGLMVDLVGTTEAISLLDNFLITI